FALVADVGDLARDTYRNGEPLPVRLAFPDGYDAEARRQPVSVRLDPAEYGRFYGTEARPDSAYPGLLIRTQEGYQVRLDEGAALPEPIATIAACTNRDSEQLQGAFVAAPGAAAVPGTTAGALRFDRVRFV